MKKWVKLILLHSDGMTKGPNQSPGAVSAVDAAPVGQLTGLKVVLGLLSDAHLLQHRVRHILLHLGCRGARGGGEGLARQVQCSFSLMLSHNATTFVLLKQIKDRPTAVSDLFRTGRKSRRCSNFSS